MFFALHKIGSIERNVAKTLVKALNSKWSQRLFKEEVYLEIYWMPHMLIKQLTVHNRERDCTCQWILEFKLLKTYIIKSSWTLEVNCPCKVVFILMPEPSVWKVQINHASAQSCFQRCSSPAREEATVLQVMYFKSEKSYYWIL